MAKSVKGVNDLETYCKKNNLTIILEEWNYQKNSPLLPCEVGRGTTRKVWWLGKCGHEWQNSVANRVSQNQGCPYCSGHKVLKGFNDLETTNPELAKEWDYKRNLNISPSMFTAGSGKKVWWICSKCNNNWEALISGRNYGFGCPKCAAINRGKKQSIAKKEESLGVKYPTLLNEWDYDKNTDISPYETYPSSNKSVWWICQNCGNEWKTPVCSRTGNNTGCPKCSKISSALQRKLPSLGNDLASAHPRIAKEWHPTKNGNLRPTEVNRGSARAVWWLCKYGHEWKAQICSRTQPDGSNCPVCMKEAITSFPEQAILFYLSKNYNNVINSDRSLLDGYELDIYIPEISTAIEYDGFAWHKNNIAKDKKKNSICKQSGIKLIRIREQGLPLFDDCVCIIRTDDHSYPSLEKCLFELFDHLKLDKTTISIEKDRDSILEQYLSIKKKISLQTLFPEIAAEWHPLKNGTITPDMISAHFNKKVWWLGKCGHEWQSSPNNRCGKQVGCPYCSNPPVKILAGFNDLATTNPELLSEWHPTKNGTLSPTDVSHGTMKKVWWLGKCGHEWQAAVASRAGNMKLKCPYCSNQKILSGFNDLATTNPELLLEWHPTKNGTLSPSDVSRGSKNKVWWLGKCGHEWQASISSRTRINGTGCPKCAKTCIKRIINLDTGEIFNKLEDAAKSAGVSKSCICRCCLKQRKTTGGYHWAYYDQ